MTCAIKCIWKCLFALSDTPPDSHSLCKFNCAAKLCANITTADHLGAEEVESCVNSCGGNCTQNYLSS
ncbi:hypothetical protein AAG906_035277 [Vitis piasezkii]